MIYFECPLCLEDTYVENEDLPNTASENIDVECVKCNGEMNISWRAEIVVNTVSVEAGDLIL